MKQIASKLGLGHLALLLGGCVFFAGLESGAGALYLTQQAQAASSSGATAIVQAALNIVYHISLTTANPNEAGSVFTYYNSTDSRPSPYTGFNQPKLLQYWKQGSANLLDVECAGFVAAVLDQANYSMVQPLPYAIDYWLHPGNSFPSSEWQYVLPLQGGQAPPGIHTISGMPLPGDVAVFTNTGGNESNVNNDPGHVALVVAVNPPTSGQKNGTIVLAQANFPPNYDTLDPANSTWKGANPVSWITTKDIPLYVTPFLATGNMDLPGQTLLGYIRNLKAQVTSGSVASGAPLPADKSAIMAEIQPVLAKYDVPPLLVETIIQVESGWNTHSLGDQGTSYGLFQLHIGGQADAAIRDGYTPTDLYEPLLNARYAMPAIAAAWDDFKGSFNADSMSWWLSFAAKSGHPGGNPANSVTINEATLLQKAYKSLQ